MSPSEKVGLASAAFLPTARQITVKRPRRVINANRVTCCELSSARFSILAKKKRYANGACNRNHRTFVTFVIFNQAPLVSSSRHRGIRWESNQRSLKICKKGYGLHTRFHANTETNAGKIRNEFLKKKERANRSYIFSVTDGSTAAKPQQGVSDSPTTINLDSPVGSHNRYGKKGSASARLSSL